MQLVPACVTVTVCPATVAVPVLDDVEVLAATVSVVDPLPLPCVVGGMVIHAALDDTDHVHPAVVVTVTVATPPPVPIDAVVGDTEYVQDAPAWFTVTLCPATVSVALRDEVELLAATVAVTDPLPAPLVGQTLVHVALEDTDQVQPAGAVTDRLALAPPAPTDTVSGDTA